MKGTQTVTGNAVIGRLRTLRPRGGIRRAPRRAVFGIVILAAVAIAAIGAEQVAPYDPIDGSLSARLQPPGWTSEDGDLHLLGTDALGRDLLSRIVYGARISLLVGLVSVVLAGLVGTLLGMVAGYFGGRWDQVVMRLVDIQMAFPFIVLAIAVLAVLGNSLVNVVIVLAVASWVIYARLARALSLSIREKEFVEGARAIGCSSYRILMRYILPNALPSMVVIATYQFAAMIVAESALSFLGLGLPPPSPSWGASINAGRDYLAQAWWVSTFPGLALMLTIMGATFIGDWARERLDPALRV